MFTVLLLSLVIGADPVPSDVEAKFELMKIKQNYDAQFKKCTTEGQKLVVFVNFEDLQLYNRLLKEYPSNTLYCFQKQYQGIEKGIVVGTFKKDTLERSLDVKPDALESLFPKPKQIVPKVEAPKRVHYPVRGNFWTGCPDWTHLTKGVHAGKFDKNWLASLSWEELQSLHSDDHEGNVKWNSVVRCPH